MRWSQFGTESEPHFHTTVAWMDYSPTHAYHRIARTELAAWACDDSIGWLASNPQRSALLTRVAQEARLNRYSNKLDVLTHDWWICDPSNGFCITSIYSP